MKFTRQINQEGLSKDRVSSTSDLPASDREVENAIYCSSLTSKQSDNVGEQIVRPKVAVLISTYNGSDFLTEQLDSLAAQEDVDVEVFVRDDGSSDQTLKILKSYAERWAALADPFLGPNLGPAASFLELLRVAPQHFEYYAFCDQDDIWLPDKLRRSVSRLETVGAQAPALYCSSSMCVDRDLRPLGPTSLRGTGRFRELLFANISGGNTMVFNARAASLIRERLPGRGIIMHDWWCILIISALGIVICDEEPTILYRQHQSNAIGSAPGRISGLYLQLKQFLKNPRDFYPIHAQAKQLLELYGDLLKPSEHKALEDLVGSRRSIRSRVAYALFGNIDRFDILGSLGTRALILLGLY